MMRKYSIKAIPFIMSALLMGCGGTKEQAVEDKEPPISVKVATVEASDGQPFIKASGKVDAIQTADLGTRMMGFVDKIYVKVGDKVKKGQVLLVINNTDLQAKLARANAGIAEAKAGFTHAEKDYNRFKNLLAANSASQKEMDDMTTNFEMAKARLEVAQQVKNEVNAQFSYANIRAPFNGVVTHRFVEPGDLASPGTTLIALESPGSFEVHANVPENEISRITTGSEVRVTVKSIGESIGGRVVEVSSSAMGSSGQYLVKVVLAHDSKEIRSGMFATVDFPVQVEAADGVTLLPMEALIARGQLRGVYTVSQSNTALLRWLRLGRTHGDKIEVLAGLSPGETYVVAAQGKLYNGAKISIQ